MESVRILITMTEASERSALVQVLEQAGHVIVGMAESLSAALELGKIVRPSVVFFEEACAAGMSHSEIAHHFDIPCIFLGFQGAGDLPDKERAPLECLSIPVDPKELLLAVDVGIHRYRLEQELRQAREASESSERAKSSFLSTISHELRTPMNGVLGMTELLLLSDMNDPYRENVQLIKDSAMSLLAVLNQIIDYSKLETSTLKLRELDFRFEDLVTGVMSQYSRLAKNKGIVLEYSIDPALPGWLRGDSSKIRQVLGNLLNNAVKFTRSGHVFIEVLPMALDNGPLNDEGIAQVQVLVKDTGCGIPSKKQDTIFESFCQAEGHLARSADGLGLGLAIVARLMKVLGGAVQCSSTEGEGSIFSFILPLKQSHYELHAPLAAIGQDEAPLAGARILVAEDDLINQRFISRLLEKMGCVVDLVEDGKLALEQLQEHRYDVVFMDIEMPIMDGIEATKAIRDPQSGCLQPDIPIVALTAHAMWGDEQRCIHAGMDDYLTKPIDIDTVAAIIQSIMETG